MAKAAGDLIGYVFSSGKGDSARKIERRYWAGVSQKSDRFVDRGHALAGASIAARAKRESLRENERATLEKAGTDVRMLSRRGSFRAPLRPHSQNGAAIYSLRPTMPEAERSAAKMTSAETRAPS